MLHNAELHVGKT